MFVAREGELQELESLYGSDRFEFAVIYGRRRIGKTSLINEFCKGKRTVYYTASEVDSRENLALMSHVVLGKEATLPSYDALFSEVGNQAKTERLIFVIDEYPYLAKSEPAVSSLIQKHLDTEWKNTKLMLVLLGSSMSFMENQLLNYQSPLYGRRTAQFKIKPFTYFEAIQMFDSYNAEDVALLYAVTGGIPAYIEAVNSQKSMDENLKELFFKPSGRLYEEATNLLKQELRDPSSYNAVVSAIAQGRTRINGIADVTGLESGAISNLLASLVSLGIVKRQTPVTDGEKSRKSIYEICDFYFRFWYAFVFRNRSLIERGLGSLLYEERVKGQLSQFMETVYETISLDYLFTQKGRKCLPFIPEKIGRWWGNNPLTRREEEVDIVATGQDEILFCECKWQNQKVDCSVLSDLVAKSAHFAYKQKHYALFSKAGFTDGCREQANTLENVALISFEEMR